MGMQLKGSNGGGRGRGFRLHRQLSYTPMSEINVTPMVDVMLVLLIVFMVAAPLLTVGVPVQLPKTDATSLPFDPEEPLTVTVAAEGRVFIQKTEVTLDALIDKLRAIAATRENDRIYLKADEAVDYGQVMVVMGHLNAGVFADRSGDRPGDLNEQRRLRNDHACWFHPVGHIPRACRAGDLVELAASIAHHTCGWIGDCGGSGDGIQPSDRRPNPYRHRARQSNRGGGGRGSGRA